MNKPRHLPRAQPVSHEPLRVSALADLKGVWRQAQLQAREAARQQAEIESRQRLAEAQQALERDLFVQTVGAVQRLPDAGRQHTRPPAPRPDPLSRRADEQAVLVAAMSDDIDVDSLLETDDTLAYRRPDIGRDVLRKLRRGVWTLQGQLDLHGLRTDEAREQVNHFLKEAQSRGWRCVRVVHGKGLGSPGKVPVIKDKVKRWLVQSDKVLAFVQARADEGGAGALIVLLQPASRTR